MAAWKTTIVGDVVTLVSGGTPSRNDPRFWGGTVPWITCKDMKADRLANSSERLTEVGLEAGSRLVPPGSVLIVIRGMILARDVPVALVTKPVAFNQDLKALLPKGGIDGEFLLYALKSKTRDLQQMTARAAHGTKSLTTKNVADLEIPFPPLAEQRQIAAVLSAVQRAIERQERLIALTAELKKALMHKLFTEGTRGETLKQTEIGRVPESWDLVAGSEAFDIQQGQVDPTQAPFSEMLHLGPENIESGTGKLLALKTNAELRIRSGNYLFGKDHIVYSKIRPYLNKVALPTFEGTCSADMYPLLPRKNVFTRLFLYQFLLSPHFVKQASSHQERTGIPKINRNQLTSIHFPRPSVEEQEQIADTLRQCDEKLEVHRRSAESLRSIFRTLLHLLMTAQVRLHDLGLSALDELAAEPAGVT